MIDKVEVRIPAQARFCRTFERLYCEIGRDPNPKLNPFRRSDHYLRVGDLRPFGYAAILHIHCIRDKLGNHKVELLDTGQMTYGGMNTEIERIFACDARRLPLMRIDLAADIRGV